VSGQSFERPSAVERLFNGLVGALVRVGVGPAHMRVLEVRGRRSGRLYTLPVDPIAVGPALYLVAPRGRTQWVRNAEAAGEVTIRRGRRAERFALEALAEAERPPILAAYLDHYRREVQRFFPVRAGSAAEAFVPLAARYPVFRLRPRSREPSQAEEGSR
jgi:deazaflavin-dependent oxidoreductase (nitroreductase family)